MNNKLALWLSDELNNRGWSIRELGRRAGVSHTTVASVLSEQRSPTADFCVAVSKALNVPAESVLRMAGILPPLPGSENNPTLQELYVYCKRLSPQALEDLFRYVIFRYQSEQNEK